MLRIIILTTIICVLLVVPTLGQDLLLMPEGVVYDTANHPGGVQWHSQSQPVHHYVVNRRMSHRTYGFPGNAAL